MLTVRRTGGQGNDGRGDVDGRPRERNGGSGSRSVSEREQQRRLQRDDSGSRRGSGSASRGVPAARGVEGAAREAVRWRVGECAATGRQSE